MTTLKLIIEAEYEADPKSYGTDDPKQMAKIDLENVNNDPDVIDFLLEVSLVKTFKVEPV
jgi:hypothetical protein